MLKRTSEVKGKKDGETVVLGMCEYEEFQSIPEAIQFLASVDGNGQEVPGSGEKNALSLINAGHKTKKCNAFRIEKTRGISPMKQLREKVKSDPAAKAKLDALMKELGVSF